MVAAALELRSDSLVGSVLGNYRLTRRIGQGGMGEVYVGEHRRILRRVAVKVLLPELSANSATVARFLAEARTASLVQHPGIVQIFDCDEDRGRAFIVMELLEGETLAARLRREKPMSGDGQVAAAVGVQIARAVAAAHAAGVVHRDLKPDNVFLLDRPEGGGIVKVVDFGIAKVARPDSAGQTTQTGAVMGTPVYMSPEQCRGAGPVDHRTDVYSLGCMLFEMLSGRPPFLREGAGEYLVAHVSEPAPPLGQLTPAVPPEIEGLVGEMLAKSPDARPRDMSSVAERLAAFAASVASPPPTTLIPPFVGETVPTEALPPVGGLGRRSRYAILVGACTAAVAGGLVALSLLRPAPVTRPAPIAPAPAVAVTPPPEAVPAARPAAAGPVVPATISVAVQELPPGARVTLDGAPIALPARVAREPGRTHRLEVFAKGFVDEERSFAADADVSLSLDLRRAPSRSRTGTPTPRAASAAAKTSGRSAVDGITDL